MTDYDAIGIAEGFIDCHNDQQYMAAWQHLIDTGLAWRLQGWFGRKADQLISYGFCTAPASLHSLDNQEVDKSEEG